MMSKIELAVVELVRPGSVLGLESPGMSCADRVSRFGLLLNLRGRLVRGSVAWVFKSVLLSFLVPFS